MQISYISFSYSKISKWFFAFRNSNRNEEKTVFFESQHSDIVQTDPTQLVIKTNESSWSITVIGLKPGYSIVSANVSNTLPAE